MRKRWRVLIAVAGCLALAVAGMVGFKVWEAERFRRDPEAARIARDEKVFDTVWSTIDREYYAPEFDHARWRRLRAVYRPRIKHERHQAGLYINILTNMLGAVGTSHLAVSMPPPPLLKPLTGQVSGITPKTFGCGGRHLGLDLGFDHAEVRRGSLASMVVTDVEGGGAAEKAGMTPGDVIHSLKIMRPRGGCPHVWMRLSTRERDPREIAYDIEYRPTRAGVQRVDLPSGVRVLRFDSFSEEALGWLSKNLSAPAPKGLVLDLRHNGGGKVWVQARIAGHFLRSDAALGSTVRRGREHALRSSVSKVRYEGPLVILIGPGSASAAEVTASAFRHHRRALLVGAETAGAVLTSRHYRLPDGGQVSVAVADYRTPDGKRLEGVGVRPDRQVAQTLEAVRAHRDLPLEAAERAILADDWRP